MRLLNLLLTLLTASSVMSVQPLPQVSDGTLLQQDDRSQDGVIEAAALADLGGLYRDQERLAEAIAAFEESLELATAQDAYNLVERSLLNLAALYQVVGQFERSRNAAQTLLSLAREQGDIAREITALQNLGGVHFALGDMMAAITAYEESLGLIRSLDNPFSEAITLALLSEAYLGLKDSDTALTQLTDALAIAQTLQEEELAGALWGSIGKAYAIGGEYSLAIEALQTNLASEQASQSLLGEALAQNNLGTAFFLAGKLDAAQTHLEQAIAFWEEQRTRVSQSDSVQVSIFETQQQAYQTLQQVLVAKGQPESALVVAEQGRAQALSNLVARHLPPGSATNLAGDRLTIPEIQQVARSQNATLVQYSITYDPAALFIAGNVGQNPEADLFIWVVSPTGDIQFRQMPIPQSLQSTVAGARRSIGVPRGRDATIERLPGEQDRRFQDLYRLLIEPIQDLLPDTPSDRVVLIPQRELFLVPFAALQHDERYLIQDHTLLTAPSIRVLDQLQNAAQDRPPVIQSALIVGDPTPLPIVSGASPETSVPLPPLPGAKREAEVIASEIFNTQALIGPDATEAAVVEQLPAAQLIHLAAHGLLEYGIPAETGVRDIPGAIALAPTDSTDGLLTAAELFSLDLQATLAVLSACDTGRGDIRGDGVIGLSRALMAAGAPSVIVSLWAVPDAPTEALMVTFYRQWRAGSDKAEALRAAMLSLIEQGYSPTDWAGFTLIGRAE